MKVHRYITKGGKDLIKEYLDNLPCLESAEGYKILLLLETYGLEALEELTTRKLRGKLWEIKFTYKNRIMYVISNKDNIYILHACKKQKGKTELFEINKAIKRAKELGKEIGKKLI